MLFGLLWAAWEPLPAGICFTALPIFGILSVCLALIGEITAGQFFQGLYFVFGGMVFYGGLLGRHGGHAHIFEMQKALRT